MKFHQQLIDAITHKRVLELRYDGYYRVVEPHAYGVSDEGHFLLRCYQTAGGSQSGNTVGWKLLRADEIGSLHESGALFRGARPGYKRNDLAMQRIYAQL
ncbi:hypothetical protein [Burkholderia gladioli]|uniref:hypothetical protein n=1 Tax=Burkholderia gladioli TaxID=28095 RepID=UPI00163E2469|nr:hypothetical protein [Burkholderia gladioli]